MPRQPKRLWTQEEDDVLKRFRRENRKYSWAEIIKLGNLKGRTPKSCSHRWHNFLKSDFNGGKFSPEEDEQIINQIINQIFNPKCRDLSWVSMVEDPLLKQRSLNAIKNRWNNNLKKKHKGTILRVIEEQLMDDEASAHSVPEDVLKARMAEIDAVISQP